MTRSVYVMDADWAWAHGTAEAPQAEGSKERPQPHPVERRRVDLLTYSCDRHL